MGSVLVGSHSSGVGFSGVQIQWGPDPMGSKSSGVQIQWGPNPVGSKWKSDPMGIDPNHKMDPNGQILTPAGMLCSIASVIAGFKLIWGSETDLDCQQM